MTATGEGPGAMPPTGPFGSYPADDVTWLLTDLSQLDLEVGVEDREELIQGGRPYFEMLPVEFQPDESYLRLYRDALASNAPVVARAVAALAERILRQHDGRPPVLVSLARAGTPVGVLLRRRYAQLGIDVPHLTVSIVRGRGIDEVALAWLLARYPASRLQFVDGWTGKGAIVRELAAAISAYRAEHPAARDLSATLAVLADPGGCTPLRGTQQDFLIPSACLNSTVSGLVSRTVYRSDLIGPAMFHGAKYYAELAPADVSAEFVDTVQGHFPASGDVGPEPDTAPVTFAGWAAVERIAAEFGIVDLNLVKPGLGETTRVLLRRLPWLVLVRDTMRGHRDLAHIEALAAARGVEVRDHPDLPYACVGLIRPYPSATA